MSFIGKSEGCAKLHIIILTDCALELFDSQNFSKCDRMTITRSSCHLIVNYCYCYDVIFSKLFFHKSGCNSLKLITEGKVATVMLD